MLASRFISWAYREPDTCRQRHIALTAGMTYREPARTRPAGSSGILVAGLIVVLAAMVAALGHQLLALSSVAASPISASAPPAPIPTAPAAPIPAAPAAAPPDVHRIDHRGAVGEADGAVPDGTTVFDDELPGVAALDPALLGALRQAAIDAADDGVAFIVNSGWRSAEYQE